MRSSWFAALLALAVGGCGSSNGTTNIPSPSPTHTAVPLASATFTATRVATATVTATPTTQPTIAPSPLPGSVVEGLVLLRRDVPAGPTDSLGVAPGEWRGIPIPDAFDRSLAHATLAIEGASESFVVQAGGDGSFTLPQIPPGEYQVRLTRVLNGNLVDVVVPLRVGDRGTTTLLMELAWGQVRTRVQYQRADQNCEEVRLNYGPYVVRCGGHTVEFGDGVRSWVDEDGDGTFVPRNCPTSFWSCDFETGCENGNSCQCTSSCPFCDDCGPGLCSTSPLPYAYRCEDRGGCVNEADRCVCVASCPNCRDCPQRVCVPNCDPVRIVDLSTQARFDVPLGRTVQATALLQFSDGASIDVTALVDWSVEDPDVARVDGSGAVQGLRLGSTRITARWDDLWSTHAAVSVVEGAAVVRVSLVNALCRCGPLWLSDPTAPADEMPCLFAPRPDVAVFPVPWCREVVRVGASLRFLAFAEFADGSFEEVTNNAEWSVDPAPLGDIQAGVFLARQPGSVQIRAAYRGTVSDPVWIRVVEQPTLVRLWISVERAFADTDPGSVPSPGAEPVPPVCVGCDSDLTALVGERLQFRAVAEYDTGDWQDVTELVEWSTSEPSVLQLERNGAGVATRAGSTRVEAVLGEQRSNSLGIRVVNEATVVGLWIQPEGNDRVLARGSEMFFRAIATYDVGLVRDVTHTSTWTSSDETVARFTGAGRLAGIAAGTATVSAEFGGQRAESVSIQVYETSQLEYCDPANVNRSVWSDGFNRVVLESDCARYDVPGLVTLRYTVTETQPRGGIFDPCLDLYVYRGGEWIRTLREQGCGAPFLPADAPARAEEVLRYQTRAVWDLRDANGNLVPPGVYRIYGRFYLYYDPVIFLDITVGNPPPEPTPNPTDLASGCMLGSSDCSGGVLLSVSSREACCEYARSSQQPLAVSWCDWMVDGKCIAGACRPSPCADDMACCPPNARCLPHIPPCKLPSCCPHGALCGPLPLPECHERCCPPGLLCIPELPPCEPTPPPPCCPPDMVCIPEIPPCEPPPPRCCPPGSPCIPELPPCEPTPPPRCCPPDMVCIPEIPPCEPPPPTRTPTPSRICGGIAGFACPEGFVCNSTDSTCSVADLAGVCEPRPQACPAVYAPVCGCDGVTYKNDCERLWRGATLRHPGPCKPGT